MAELNRSKCRQNAGRSAVWPDCPEHLRADFETLSRYYGKRVAREKLEAHG